MMSLDWVTQSDCSHSGITNWRPFQAGKPRQKRPHESCHLTAFNPLFYVFELEGFFSHPKPREPVHPRLPLTKSLNSFDLSSPCSFRPFFNAFILQTCTQNSLPVGAGGRAENLACA